MQCLTHCAVPWLGWHRGSRVLLQGASAHNHPLPLIHRLLHTSTLESHNAPPTESHLTQSTCRLGLFTPQFTARDRDRFITKRAQIYLQMPPFPIKNSLGSSPETQRFTFGVLRSAKRLSFLIWTHFWCMAVWFAVWNSTLYGAVWAHTTAIQHTHMVPHCVYAIQP